MPQWGTKDGMFNLTHFYHLIVNTLSEKTNQWVIQMMDWWQKYISNLYHLPHKLRPLLCRKIFGNGVKDPSTGAGRKLQITTKTAHRLMKKQKEKETSEGGDQEGQVCTTGHLTVQHQLTAI